MNPASISIATRDTIVFPETKQNDVLFYVKSGSLQNIHLGHANNNGAMISVYKPIVKIRALEVLNNATIDSDLFIKGLTTTKNVMVQGSMIVDSNLTISNMNITSTLNSIVASLSNLSSNIDAIKAFVNMP